MRAVLHDQPHLGMALAEGLQERHEAAWADGAHHAELQLDIVELGEAFGALLGGVGLDQHLREMRAHHLAQPRQVGVVALAAEQRAAQLILQPLDGTGQRRLRHVAGLGRAREVQRLADGQEVTDLVHLHGDCPPQARPDEPAILPQVIIACGYRQPYRKVFPAGPVVLHISLEMSLSQTLLELSRRHTAALSPRERADIEDELDRLRMMRVAEDGLAAGDPLPDFSLEDGAGRALDLGRAARPWAAGAGPVPRRLVPLLRPHHAGPRGCPAGDRGAGATAVGVMPGGREVVASAAAKRAIRYPLLADPANGFARMCGLTYELSPAHIRIHKDRGRDFRTLHGEPVWQLPVPAVFVVEPSARVAWAFSDVDPARWPDPQELLASLEALRNAHALSNR